MFFVKHPQIGDLHIADMRGFGFLKNSDKQDALGEEIAKRIREYDQLRTERDRYKEQLGKLAFVYGLCSGCQICDSESVGDDICDKCVSMTFEEKEQYWEEHKQALGGSDCGVPGQED